MPEITVRDLDEETFKRLTSRAALHGRSLEEEVRHLLEEAAPLDMASARRFARSIREKLKGRPRGEDSTQIIREFRDA